MKKMDYQNVKGTEDYLPQQEALRRKIKRTLEDVFIRYGCQPLETPILNYTELLASKYSGGAEILQEMYTLSDRGERDLSLRYDLTIPFAKVVAMNPTVKKPFKRYEIGKVFRDGPIKTGRLREFTQCDVDIVGVESQIAEAELMVMAIDAFNALNLEITIQYNNRNLLSGMLKMFNVPNDKINDVILVLDKLEKIGVTAVGKELIKKNIPTQSIEAILQFIREENNRTINYFDTYSMVNKEIEKGLVELRELRSYLKYVGVDKKCVFNPFLARGLDIYTGSIYEIFLENQLIKSSIGSGGRYDNAIGGLIGTSQSFSTVGISFGLDVIYTAMELTSEVSVDLYDLDYYIIPIKTMKQSMSVARYLRLKGYKVELDMSNKKLSKLLDRANKEKVRNVVMIGETEVKQNLYKIKEMDSGKERYEPFIYAT
ncbi:histidine--tRNA ligase [Bacillus spongiae]|uniref:Histidine--tRNA ligase n=1 Tax=Bacillus spongiae TaxID=2683610 RepID=A0ABU8HAQ2_9BACI